MGENWDVVKVVVEKVIADKKLQVSAEQLEALKTLINFEVDIDRAEQVEADLHLAPGSAQLLMQVLKAIDEMRSEQTETKAKEVTLWDTMAKVLYDTQPNDDSEYIITKRR